jgi:ATP-dependent Clp protease ATP-binding subunit ClpC
MFECSSKATYGAFLRARIEAQGLGQRLARPEHVLLGLLQQPGLAARALEEHEVLVEAVRHHLSQIAPSTEFIEGEVPWARGTLELYLVAMHEAMSCGIFVVETQHVLLAMLRDEDGVPFRTLVGFEIDPEDVRNELYRLMSTQPQQ